MPVAGGAGDPRWKLCDVFFFGWDRSDHRRRIRRSSTSGSNKGPVVGNRVEAPRRPLLVENGPAARRHCDTGLRLRTGRSVRIRMLRIRMLRVRILRALEDRLRPTTLEGAGLRHGPMESRRTAVRHERDRSGAGGGSVCLWGAATVRPGTLRVLCGKETKQEPSLDAFGKSAVHRTVLRCTGMDCTALQRRHGMEQSLGVLLFPSQH
mmetsp:Transcript_8682/g.25695  ORF Transcript_8682/g.25695 Transcript_8682/m.25695 type:complete len:208 (-) Transcript_8682:290-913(-)